MDTTLDYEDLFLKLTDKLLQSKEYNDNWSISKKDPIFYDQFNHCKEGWNLTFRYYKNLEPPLYQKWNKEYFLDFFLILLSAEK